MRDATAMTSGLLLTLLLVLPATRAAGEGGDSMGFFETRKVLSEAREAMAKGDLDEAMTLYRRVLVDSSAGDKKREEALYNVALIRMSPSAKLHDLKEARARLLELRTSFPDSDRRADVQTYLALISAVEDEQQSAQTAQETLAAAQASVEQLRGQLTTCEGRKHQQVVTVADQSAKVASLEAEVKTLQARVESLQADVRQKDEALRKVAATLVGGKKQ